MQFQSDLLAPPLERTKVPETTALGAAGIAGISSGFWPLKEFRHFNGREKRFKPTLERKKFELFYLKWQDAVKRSMHWLS